MPFQNSLFSQCKKWKIEKIEFFCAYCVHTQKNFMRQLFDVMLFSKKFFMIFWNVLGTKIFVSKFFFPKKRVDHWNVGKIKKKKWKMADFRKSAGIWVQYLGGPFLGIRENFCKNNYMIWVLNAFCVHQKFVSIILT